MNTVHTRSTVVVVMTPAEFEALRSLSNAANSDGDHTEWLQSAGLHKKGRDARKVSEFLRTRNHKQQLELAKQL
jgi:hypothetical protein